MVQFAQTQAVGTPSQATNTLVGALQQSTAQQRQIKATDKNSQRQAETALIAQRLQAQSAAAGQAAETERNDARIAGQKEASREVAINNDLAAEVEHRRVLERDTIDYNRDRTDSERDEKAFKIWDDKRRD